MTRYEDFADRSNGIPMMTADEERQAQPPAMHCRHVNQYTLAGELIAELENSSFTVPQATMQYTTWQKVLYAMLNELDRELIERSTNTLPESLDDDEAHEAIRSVMAHLLTTQFGLKNVPW